MKEVISIDTLLREKNPPPGQKPAIVPQYHDKETAKWHKVHGKDGKIYVKDSLLVEKIDQLIAVVSAGAGSEGSRWFHGEGHPEEYLPTGLGAVGDYYLDTDAGGFYRFSMDDDTGDTQWTYVTNLSGKSGKSTYELWLDAGNEGTVEDFLESLKVPAVIDGGTFFGD